MLFKTLVTILICDAVFVIISIPLILRKVPRNIVYGFRIRATLEDDFVWYAANAYFGKLFFYQQCRFCIIDYLSLFF